MLFKSRHKQVIDVDLADYDLLTFAEVSYRRGGARHDAFFSKGMQLFRDVRDADTGLRLFMLLPSWFPPARRRDAFDYASLPETVTVAFVFRGTDSDLAGNVKADAELIWSKLADSDLPEIAGNALSRVKSLLQDLRENHPALQRKSVQLNVVATGHSLGGFLAEVVTVLLHEYCEKEHINWRCSTFESPGLPDYYYKSALASRGPAYWEQRITTYLAAPNPINMLHSHLGKIVHVQVPFDQTISYMVKCVTVDAARCWLLKAAASGVVVAAQSLTSEISLATQIRAAGLELAASFFGGSVSSCYEAMATICGVLGVEISELMEQHRVVNFHSCFDLETGDLLPQYRVDMQSWPCLGDYKQSLGQLVKSAFLSLLPSFVCPNNMGLMNMGDRNGMIRRRYSNLPGYVPVGKSCELAEQPTGEEAAAAQVQADPLASTSTSTSSGDNKFAVWRQGVIGKRRKTGCERAAIHTLGSVRQLGMTHPGFSS